VTLAAYAQENMAFHILGVFMKNNFTILVVCAFSIAFSATNAAAMTDCTYAGSISGKTAVIVVRGGEPVSYQWGGYKARKVSQSGSTILIDQARIENVRAGATQAGKAAFQGKWNFNGNSSDVTFICR
jgi:hypothetical protein